MIQIPNKPIEWPPNACRRSRAIRLAHADDGPILLGLAKPVAAMQNDATIEEIVNMTSHVVLKAQRMREAHAESHEKSSDRIQLRVSTTRTLD